MRAESDNDIAVGGAVQCIISSLVMTSAVHYSEWLYSAVQRSEVLCT